MSVKGILLVHKPPNISSHGVVVRIRTLFRIKRVGHAGTLDPFATGLLILCLGEATKIAEYVADFEKEYVAVMKLGEATDTQDYTGQVLARHAGDGNSFISAPIDIEALRYWRTKVSFGAWIKDLRTEQFQLLYREPIMPKNRFMAKPPGSRSERMEVERTNVEKLIKRGVYTRPGRWADEDE